jgi:hypothetical protein
MEKGGTFSVAQEGEYRWIPGTRSKSASRLARCDIPKRCMRTTISPSLDSRPKGVDRSAARETSVPFDREHLNLGGANLVNRPTVMS